MWRASWTRSGLGRTDSWSRPICFGTSGLGDMPDTYGYGVDEARARATIQAIFDETANFIDTARNYGHGRSEERLGAVIRERGGLPPGFVISTKLDRDFETSAFDASRARRSLEQSLKTLGLRSGRSPASPRSRARPLVRRGDRQRRRTGRTVPHQRGRPRESGGAGGWPGVHDDAAPAELGFRRADHPQSLPALRQSQRRRHARSRSLQGDRGPERSALRQRRARQGVDRLPALRLCGSGPRRCSIRSARSRRSARCTACPGRGGATVLDARPPHRFDHLRRRQARAGQADGQLGALSIPDEAWVELMALSYATEDPEATRDYKLG